MEVTTITPQLYSDSPKVGGNGAFSGSRDVWLVDFEGKRAVVKYIRSADENAQEVKLWDMVQDTDLAPMFAEVYAHTEHFQYIVMERVAHVLSEYDPQVAVGETGSNLAIYRLSDPVVHENYIKFLEILFAKCRERGIRISDTHPGNIGIREDGTFAVIDYASFSRSSNINTGGWS